MAQIVTQRDLEMELHDGIENITLGLNTLLRQNNNMRAMLLKAADHFTACAVHHAAKVPPDWDRSSVNEALAKQCREAAEKG